MKEKTIQVLKVEPHKLPEVVELPNKLEALQEAVSIGCDYVGLIEILSLDERTCILCNEEGKLNGMEPNRRLGCDVLCGVFYVTGQDREENLTSLPDEAIEQYAERFLTPEDISQEEVERSMIMRFFPF